MAVKETISRLPKRISLPWVIVGGIALMVLLASLLVVFGVHHELVKLLQWVNAQGAWAAVIFVVIMALVVVLLLPGIFFTTAAGFVFGVPAGTLYVVAGSTLGAGLAFIIARYFFSDSAKSYVLAHQKLNAFSREAHRHDFKVVLLTRLIPFFPGKLSNYVFGLTTFRFSHYLVATFLGFIPFSLHNVYLGSIAADLASLGAGEFERSPLQWAMYGLGFIATAVAVVFFNRLAQRSLANFQTEDKVIPGESE